MSTLAPQRPEAAEPEERPPAEGSRPPLLSSRWLWALGIVALWIVIWAVTKGNDTLAIDGRERNDVQQALTRFRDDVLASRDSNPIIQLTYEIGGWFNSVVDWLQRMISVDNFPRPVPEIGWLGVTAVATWLGLAVAGWRISIVSLGPHSWM